MKYRWFVPWGWIYRPASAIGWLFLIAGALFAIQVFLAIDAHSHSATDTLYGIFAYFISIWLLFDWLGGRTSARRED